MNKLLNIDSATKFLTLASLAIAVFAAWTALPLDAELKVLQAETQRLDNELKSAEAKLREAEASRKLNFELYREVKTLLEDSKRTEQEEEALRVLIESLADAPFRYKLLDVLAVAAGNSSTRKAASESSKFYKEEAVLSSTDTKFTMSGIKLKAPVNAMSVTNYDIDVFYCANKRETSEPIAQQVAALKLPSETGRWRVRALPETINQQPGYQIQSSQIRYNSPSENKQADILIKRLEEKGIHLDRRVTTQNTRWYLSIFICQ